MRTHARPAQHLLHPRVIAKPKLLALFDRLRTSFLLIPLSMSLGAIVLARVLLAIDTAHDWSDGRWGKLLYAGSADGARSLLGSLAGSIIAVTGTIFSITILALTFASTHLGPRLLRNFTADRVNQVVLGTFVATFLLCLMVLSGFGSEGDELHVPRFAISIALVVSTLSFGVMIYFIHHVAHSLQVDNVVKGVRDQLERSILQLYPDPISAADSVSPADPVAWKPLQGARTILAEGSGYVLAIDHESQIELAREHDLRIELAVRPGHFVSPSSPLMRIEGGPADDRAGDPADGESKQGESVREHLDDDLRRTCGLEAQRTPMEDVEFSVRQLVEIALRALSPGVNDPFTAISCIDHLSAALACFVKRDTPDQRVLPDRDEPLVLALAVGFEGIMKASWNQIRQHGAAQPAVAIRMLEAFERLALEVETPQQRRVIDDHALRVATACLDGCADPNDRVAVEERMRHLSTVPAPPGVAEQARQSLGATHSKP